MKVITVENYDKMCARAAKIIIGTVKGNPYAVLGLATGSTPLGLYRLLAADCKKGGYSYKHIRTVNLDEYIGLSAMHPQSYACFMRKNLFEHIDIDLSNTFIENGTAEDETAECKRYDNLLEALPRDVQLLGLGSNGHIAFNEPGTPFGATTHVVNLTESTIVDNARFFTDKAEVPKKAFTMGIKNIMQAKKIVLLASGESKAEVVYKTVKGEVNENCPASILQLHSDCTLIADRGAAKKISSL